MIAKWKLAAAALTGLALVAGLSLGLHAAPGENQDSSASVKLPRLEFRDVKLDNGLRVILVPDHSAPVYAIDVATTWAAATSGPDAPDSRTCSST